VQDPLRFHALFPLFLFVSVYGIVPSLVQHYWRDALGFLPLRGFFYFAARTLRPAFSPELPRKRFLSLAVRSSSHRFPRPSTTRFLRLERRVHACLHPNVESAIPFSQTRGVGGTVMYHASHRDPRAPLSFLITSPSPVFQR